MTLETFSPKTTKSWKSLEKLSLKPPKISELFIKQNRFEKFHLVWEDLLLDYSKNRINEKIWNTLLEFADEMKLSAAIEKMFSGEKINFTENRAVLHTALRSQAALSFQFDSNANCNPISKVLLKMKNFSDGIISGNRKGFSGKKFESVVNIGIGGSDLGPNFVVEALLPYRNHLKLHFVSNIDGSSLNNVLNQCNAETTLFIIASKTFSTQETITNAMSAKSWFMKYSKDHNFIEKHFVAISTNIEAATKFGVLQENIFYFWDWVGGRFSLWSAVGLSISISIGFENFISLLKGAGEMDTHFRSASFDKNLAVILALVGIWNRNFLKYETEAILPYDQLLHRFPAYLQQTSMESNGKYVSRAGRNVEYHTGSIIWGEPGTNGQHSFFQLIHQGTSIVPCDFLIGIEPQHKLKEHHNKLIANFLGQTKALAFGKSLAEVRKEMRELNYSEDIIKKIEGHKVFKGNRPSNSIIYNKLCPHTLGRLIAMYEHKIFVQGIFWNIFSFDQWGVELGKQLATEVLSFIDKKIIPNSLDSSTKGMLSHILKKNR